nr:hypothetical protein 19 [bacterium]
MNQRFNKLAANGRVTQAELGEVLGELRVAIKRHSSLKEVAWELRIPGANPGQVLANRTCPTDESGHKLGLIEFVHILEIIGDLAPLEAVARLFGHRLRPVGAGGPEDLGRLLNELTAELGEATRAYLDGEDPEGPGGAGWTPAELDRAEREARDVVERAEALLAALAHKRKEAK